MTTTRALALGVVVLTSACGSRSGLNVDQSVADAATESCAVPPLCADNTRGTWRLETPDHAPAGYLFTFDGSAACNGSPDAMLLVLASSCSRNGDYVIHENTDTAFQVSADNLGGNFTPACGGDPGTESLNLKLERSACESSQYDLVVHDSKTPSPYDFTALATRCRCDVGFEPCVSALPADPCAP